MNVINENRFNELTSKLSTVDNILVLGDVGIDHYIYGSVDRISPEAPVPVLRVTREEQKLGMAANICHNIFALGAHSSLVSIVGDDLRGNMLKKMMTLEGVQLDGLIQANDVQTISKERILTERQQICRVDYEPEFPSFSEKNLNNLIKAYQKELEKNQFVILEDYSKGILTEKTIRQFINLANEANKFIAVDPGRGKPAIFYKGASLLKPNLSEAKELVHSLGYSTTDIGEVINILSEKLEINRLAVTLGPKGMALLDRTLSENVTIIPTLASEVFDVSGAGDTVIAVMTMALSSGATLVEAGWLSNLAAGVVVSKHGTATVNLNELSEYYSYIKNKK